jgi:hypothetical protein
LKVNGGIDSKSSIMVVQVLTVHRLKSRQVNEIPKEGLYGVEIVRRPKMSVGIDGWSYPKKSWTSVRGNGIAKGRLLEEQ